MRPSASSRDARYYSILSLAFIASSFRVTEENLVFETVQSGPWPILVFRMFSLLLKELTFIFYLMTKQGIVPDHRRGETFSGHKQLGLGLLYFRNFMYSNLDWAQHISDFM